MLFFCLSVFFKIISLWKLGQELVPNSAAFRQLWNVHTQQEQTSSSISPILFLTHIYIYYTLVKIVSVPFVVNDKAQSSLSFSLSLSLSLLVILSHKVACNARFSLKEMLVQDLTHLLSCCGHKNFCAHHEAFLSNPDSSENRCKMICCLHVLWH